MTSMEGFEKGITDSWADDLAVMDCLGFVDGVCCPHYDEEPTRRPYVKAKLASNDINQCIGVEGHAALHIINEESYKSVNFGLLNLLKKHQALRLDI